jgi:hypothetical protein
VFALAGAGTKVLRRAWRFAYWRDLDFIFDLKIPSLLARLQFHFWFENTLPGLNRGSMTKHKADCEMSFGRKDPTCERCRELLAGAGSRDGWQRRYFSEKKRTEENRLAAIRTHDCKVSGCGPVCVAFDW